MTDAQPWLQNYPRDIDWNADIRPGTLVGMLEESVRKHGDQPCLSFMGKKMTYAETGEAVKKFARALQDMGITKGSKVGLCLPNTPFYVIAYYGALMAGATVVNFNPLYGEKELEHQINDSQTDLMVTINVPQVLPKVQKLTGTSHLKKTIVCDIADALPATKKTALKIISSIKGLFGNPARLPTPDGDKFASFSSLMAKTQGAPAPVSVTPDDLAVLQYTGGTTGVPKGAMLTHGNLTSNLEQANMWFSSGKKDDMQEKVLVVLPFFHVFSMTVQMNLSLSRGAEILMLPKFDLRQTLKTITKEKPTMFAGVPTLYKAIIDCKKMKNYDLSSLKICLSGGAALNEPVARGWTKLTGLELIEGYGLSETAPLATANPVYGDKILNSIGMPVPRTDIKITDIENPEKRQAPGTSGEICIKGPQVMRGYWNNLAETQKVMDSEGYFHTGDVGHVDPRTGYIFIDDRLKDMINASGMKVFPRKVEEAILQHQDVSEAIVIGVPDDYRGENVKAFLVMKEGKQMTREALKAFLEDKLSPYEIPKILELRDALPKTMIGKPDKKALAQEERDKAAKKAAKNGGPKP